MLTTKKTDIFAVATGIILAVVIIFTFQNYLNLNINTTQAVETQRTVEITAPNGGEILQPGGIYHISWDQTNIDKVTIYLMKTASLVANTVVNNHEVSINNTTGSYSYTIPADAVETDTYKVRIIAYQTGLGSVEDWSDSEFSIQEGACQREGELVKTADSDFIYLIENCQRKVFPNTTTLIYYGYSLDDVLIISASEKDEYPLVYTFPDQTKPDLAINEIIINSTIFGSAPEIDKGAQFTASVRYHNNGDKSSDKVKIYFYIDDVYQGYIYSSETINVTDPSNFYTSGVINLSINSLGTHTIKAKIDGLNSVDESNEDNNIATMEIEIVGDESQKPDLKVNKLKNRYNDKDEVMPSTISLGDTLAFEVIVDNLGTAISPDTTLDFSVEGEFQKQVTLWSIINGGSGHNTKFWQWTPSQVKSYTIKITLDPANTVDELDEINNIYYKTITVVGEEACSDSDGGKDYFTKGTATKGSTSVTDHCYSDDSNKLKEKYCDSSGNLQVESYICPNGCDDGVCKTSDNDDDDSDDDGDNHDDGDDSDNYSDEYKTLKEKIARLQLQISDLEQKVVDLEKSLLSKIDTTLTNRLRGRILLQVENNGEAWYVDKITLKKFYLKDGASAYNALQAFGLGITNDDLAKIPIGIEDRAEITDTDGDGLDDKLEESLGTDINDTDSDDDGHEDGDEVKTGNNPKGSGTYSFQSYFVDNNDLRGKILLQVESRGEAWYIHPEDGKRYYMKDGALAYQIMRFLSLGITNEDLRKIDVGEF